MQGWCAKRGPGVRAWTRRHCHPPVLIAITRILLQVDEVKNIMVDNIEKVLERGEKIELLVDKTDNLRFQVGPGSVCVGAQHW